MQPDLVRTSNLPGKLVAGLLWLGIGAAAVWLVAKPAFPASPGLPLAIGFLTLFVAATVATFSLRYMRADERSTRYFLTLSALVSAVLAFLFTGNLIGLGTAWCASGWLLAGLIGHSGGWQEARAAAARTRLTFLAGDIALVAALAVLGWNAGSAQVGAALAGASTLPAVLAAMTGLLLVVAAAARCALPPFSGWLFSSMTAPTPVSALMHAGMVNAGGFLLLRFAPVLEAAPGARFVAIATGLCASIYGIGVMVVRPDVKRALAGSTVSQMGFMIMSCGLGAYSAALWHIIAHGLFKAWLFLGSGSTVGTQAGKPGPHVYGTMTATVAGMAAAAALALLLSGQTDVNMVPALLAVATAGTTLLAALASAVPARARAVLLLALAALIAFHSAGLALTGTLIGGRAPSPVPGWVVPCLLLVFLGGWIWQHKRVSTSNSLPLRLYVHLINVGTLPAGRNGEHR